MKKSTNSRGFAIFRQRSAAGNEGVLGARLFLLAGRASDGIWTTVVAAQPSYRTEGMLYSLARLLQLAGMISLLLGSAGNLAEKISVSAMYQVLFAGVGLFIVGYSLQQAVGKK